jgi:hypothetical protein
MCAEHGGSTILPDVGTYEPNYVVSHGRKQQRRCLLASPWEPQVKLLFDNSNNYRNSLPDTRYLSSEFVSSSAAQRGLWPPRIRRFLDHAQRRATVGKSPLDEWSARRRDLCLTTHNRQTSMSPVEFEPNIAVDERPQTYALDREATGTGFLMLLQLIKLNTLLVFTLHFRLTFYFMVQRNILKSLKRVNTTCIMDTVNYREYAGPTLFIS